MKKILLNHLIFATVFAAVLSCGQSEPLTEYEPQSPQEQALKTVLLDFQDGVNRRDSKKIEKLLHADASLMTGRERKILNRVEYLKILPQRLAENPPIGLGKPKIDVFGDKAEVRIYITRGDYNGLVIYNMKLENNQWYILGWQY
jgi:hypothetical protein